jgi:hypothetical protein
MIKPLAVLAALAALLLAPNAHAASANLVVIDPDPGESLSGGLAKTFTGDWNVHRHRTRAVSGLGTGGLGRNPFDDRRMQHDQRVLYGQRVRVGCFQEQRLSPGLVLRR